MVVRLSAAMAGTPHRHVTAIRRKAAIRLARTAIAHSACSESFTVRALVGSSRGAMLLLPEIGQVVHDRRYILRGYRRLVGITHLFDLGLPCCAGQSRLRQHHPRRLTGAAVFVRGVR